MVKSREPETDIASDVAAQANTKNRISGDRIIVQCRKPGKWETFRMSAQHHGFETTARMNAVAILEQGYKNVRN